MSASSATAWFLGVLLVATAAGAAPAAPDTHVPAVAARTAALERLDRTREQVAGGSVADAVAAAATLAQVPLTPRPHASVPGAPGAALPPALAQPVAALLAAMDRAEAALHAALPRDPERVERALRLPDRLPVAAGDAAAWSGADRRLVDQAALLAGGFDLASAVDAALPALRAYAAAAPRTGAVAGCDVFEQPQVCIGGAGANTYTKDAALLIDLGGDDVHRNAAGGADARAGMPVAVVIDLDGDDLYSTNVPTASGLAAAQGGGQLGIGVLVDVAGDDRYETHATTIAATADTFVQGGGGAGLGLLADLEGDDVHVVGNTAASPFGARATGLGFGVLGVGIAVDRAGDDEYLVEAAPGMRVDEQGRFAPPVAIARGLGFTALGGTALVADGGGRDALSLHALPPDVPADASEQLNTPPTAVIDGLSYAFTGGATAVLLGEGRTTNRVIARSSGPSTGAASIAAFGFAGVGGYASVHDAGGDDVYLAEATTTALSRNLVNASCRCMSLVRTSSSGVANVLGGGYAAAGVAVLQDGGGHDRYSARAESTAEALSHDVSPASHAGGVGAVAEAHNADVVMFGFGAVGGTALALDHGGTDAYDQAAISRASATATGDQGTLEPTAVSTSRPAASSGQGAAAVNGYGELRNTGGADTYRSQATSAATATPATEVVPGSTRSSVFGSTQTGTVQGSDAGGGAALFADVDGGASDSFALTPDDPACEGTRGKDVWRDCGQYLGLGVNR